MTDGRWGSTGHPHRPAEASAAAPGLSASVLPSLCDGAIETAERRDLCEEACLEPAEAEIVRTSVPGRRREFATVRCCARDAMVRSGVRPCAVLPREDGPAWGRRAPRWPPGLVGSLTHCEGFYGAALAHSSDVQSIGIDAEPHAPLPDEVKDAVLLPDERRAVHSLMDTAPNVAWDRLVFSAKESVYKAWYPVTGGWLDFADCVIRFHPTQRRFDAEVLVAAPTPTAPRSMTGRWHAEAQLLVTAVVVPRREPSAT